jgi:hypothetical protein
VVVEVEDLEVQDLMVQVEQAEVVLEVIQVQVQVQVEQLV